MRAPTELLIGPDTLRRLDRPPRGADSLWVHISLQPAAELERRVAGAWRGLAAWFYDLVPTGELVVGYTDVVEDGQRVIGLHLASSPAGAQRSLDDQVRAELLEDFRL